MDRLQAEIARMKRNSTGKRWVRRGDIEKEREQKYLEEQEVRNKAKAPKIEAALQPTLPASPTPQVEITLTQEEVVAKLRKAGEPAKLFGESLADQCDRLRRAERKLAEQGSAGARPSLLNYQSREKVFWDGFEEEKEGMEEVGEWYAESELMRDAREWDEFEDRGEVYRKHKEHPLKLEAASLPYLSKLSFLHRWCSEILCLWEADLSDPNLAVGEESEKPQSVKKLKETKQALKGLVRLLRPMEVGEEIVNEFFLVARFCQIRSYVKAHDHYLALASGKIPWTSQKPDPKHRGGLIISIFYTESISEETYRLYTQSFKRLVTICQRKYPNVPSKIVMA